MELKLYVDRMSQPSRAVLIFCKVTGIEFEEVKIEISKMQHRSAEFAEINPMKQLPAMVHGDFKLCESHAILIYLASALPGVADNWYPTDVCKRAKIHSVLDWHHSNLRRGSVGYLFNAAGIALALGLPLDPKAADEGEKLLSKSLAIIESYWLEDGPFLLGNSRPSIADLALVCEIMQLEFVDKEDRDRILSPFGKIQKWVEETKKATSPYFDKIHSIMPTGYQMLKQLKAQASKE